MDKMTYDAPAFPPQILQDSLGRIIAPVSGMSRLDYFSLQLLPTFLQLSVKTKLSANGKPVTAVEAAIEAAKQLLDQLEKTKDNGKDVLQIIE